MSTLKELLSTLRTSPLAFQTALVERNLTPFVKSNFEENYRFAREVFETLPKLADTKFAEFEHPQWRIFSDTLQRYFLSEFSAGFLRHPLIRRTMFLAKGGAWQSAQLGFLRSRRSDAELEQLLRETMLGRPLITERDMLTSHNTIHHLYHLTKYEDRTLRSIDQFGSVVEFGGGYGNMARLVRKLSPAVRYTIVDLPLFSCIQYVYLATLLGKDAVNLAREPRAVIREGMINLVPTPYIDMVPDDAGLFLSTWALSECTAAAQEYVASRNFFGASGLLLAYARHDGIFDDPVNKMCAATTFPKRIEEKIELQSNSYYLFS